MKYPDNVSRLDSSGRLLMPPAIYHEFQHYPGAAQQWYMTKLPDDDEIFAQQEERFKGYMQTVLRKARPKPWEYQGTQQGRQEALWDLWRVAHNTGEFTVDNQRRVHLPPSFIKDRKSDLAQWAIGLPLITIRFLPDDATPFSPQITEIS